MDKEAIREQAKKKTMRECLRCLWKWLDSGKGKPKVCPKCHSPYWDVPRERE